MYLSQKIVARLEAKLEAGVTSLRDAMASSSDAVASDSWVGYRRSADAQRSARRPVDGAIEQRRIQDVASLNRAFEQIERDYRRG